MDSSLLTCSHYTHHLANPTRTPSISVPADIISSVQLRIVVGLDVAPQQSPPGPRPGTDLDDHPPAPPLRRRLIGRMGPTGLDAGLLPPQEGDGHLVLVGGRGRDELQDGPQVAVVEVVDGAEPQEEVPLHEAGLRGRRVRRHPVHQGEGHQRRLLSSRRRRRRQRQRRRCRTTRPSRLLTGKHVVGSADPIEPPVLPVLHARHGAVPILHGPLARLGIELGLGLGRRPPPPLLLVGRRRVPPPEGRHLDHARLHPFHEVLVVRPDLVEAVPQRPRSEHVDVAPRIAVGVDEGRVDPHGLAGGVVGRRGQQLVDDGGRLRLQRPALRVEPLEVVPGRLLELVVAAGVVRGRGRGSSAHGGGLGGAL
mmetsp:Transcript_4655/g.13161  ORF Transcript_4655/g.13161 Transcript_4655/m.13161 type:complete len:366 (+) Transcript_4655:946-2043(+)